MNDQVAVSDQSLIPQKNLGKHLGVSPPKGQATRSFNEAKCCLLPAVSFWGGKNQTDFSSFRNCKVSVKKMGASWAFRQRKIYYRKKMTDFQYCHHHICILTRKEKEKRKLLVEVFSQESALF